VPPHDRAFDYLAVVPVAVTVEVETIEDVLHLEEDIEQIGRIFEFFEINGWHGSIYTLACRR
jgi:hypothetical protein